MIADEELDYKILTGKAPITPRQCETLSLVMQGYTWREAAAIQGVAKYTVEKSLSRARDTCQAVNNITMIVDGFCKGWIVSK